MFGLFHWSNTGRIFRDHLLFLVYFAVHHLLVSHSPLGVLIKQVLYPIPTDHGLWFVQNFGSEWGFIFADSILLPGNVVESLVDRRLLQFFEASVVIDVIVLWGLWDFPWFFVDGRNGLDASLFLLYHLLLHSFNFLFLLGQEIILKLHKVLKIPIWVASGISFGGKSALNSIIIGIHEFFIQLTVKFTLGSRSTLWPEMLFFAARMACVSGFYIFVGSQPMG